MTLACLDSDRALMRAKGTNRFAVLFLFVDLTALTPLREDGRTQAAVLLKPIPAFRAMSRSWKVWSESLLTLCVHRRRDKSRRQAYALGAIAKTVELTGLPPSTTIRLALRDRQDLVLDSFCGLDSFSVPNCAQLGTEKESPRHELSRIDNHS